MPTLGIDLAPAAVEQARARGATALERDVFGRVPGTGRWRYVLLADGNVGIGGDPHRLLARVAALLAPDGCALVELDAPGTPSRRVRARLHSRPAGRPATRSHWFGWAHVAVDDIAATAHPAGLRVAATWSAAGRDGERWFARLARR